MPEQPVEEVLGQRCYEWTISKRVHRESPPEVIEELLEPSPPTRDYVRERWSPVYGGGTYYIRQGSLAAGKVILPGDPIYVEDHAAAQRSEEEARIASFLANEYHKVEAELRRERERRAEELAALRQARLRATEEAVAREEQRDPTKEYAQLRAAHERVVKRITGPAWYEHPIFVRAANALIDRFAGRRPGPPRRPPRRPDDPLDW